MPVTATRVVGPQVFATTNTLLTGGTVPAATLWKVRHIHIQNPSAGALPFTLAIKTAATAANRLYDGYSLPAGAVLDTFCYYALVAGETLYGFEATGVVVVTIDADVVTLG
jgi:hypothetical protein